MRGKVFSWAAISALHAAHPAAAQEDTQLWITGAVVVPVEENLSANVEISPRVREAGDQVLGRATLEWKLSDQVTVAGGAAFVEFSGGNEFRPHQQVVVSFGPLLLRSRLEERFFPGADRAQIRLRQRVQLSVPLTHATRIGLGGELLYIARSEDVRQDERVDQWRAQVTLQHRVSRHFDASVGYLIIYSPRSGAPDRISHVPQLSLTWRP